MYYESLNLWLLLYSESVSVSSLPGGGNVDIVPVSLSSCCTVALKIN